MATTFMHCRPLSMRGPALPVRSVILPGGAERTESVLTPRRISGSEGVGELFEYRVEAHAPLSPMFFDQHAISQIELNKIAGTEVTLSMDLQGIEVPEPGRGPAPAARSNSAGTREISGFVESAAVLGVEGSVLLFEFVVRPWCWLATLSTNSRSFNGPIIDVLHDVLHAYPGTIEWRINGMQNPQRDFIRQAWETDWNFFLRLCEEFGFVIWFEHRDATHVLVVADNPDAYHEHEGAYATLRYHKGGGHIHEEYISRLSFASTVTSGKVTVSDHSYMSPRLDRSRLPYREEYEFPGATGNAHEEIYTRADYAQPRTRPDVLQDDNNWRDDARFLARVQMEALRCRGLRAEGGGHLRGVESGKTFTLTHYPHKSTNRDYLVTGCTLDIRQTGGTSTTMAEYAVESSFELHPVSEPYRMPQVTPRPRIDGCEYAVIVGPKDAEMFVDAYNRVLIQCAWDRDGGFDGSKSIWVRVAATWQGDQLGIAVHGRCGQQVLVKYVNGDPDRPYIAAFVVDRDNMPPWKLPENQALSGMVSRSLGRRSTTNHLALDDTENRQQAQLASDHAKSSLSLGYITRIEGNAGRQDACGEGFELRTDAHGALRAALGLLITTVARPGARGKVKDMGETIARLTRSRDVHESLSQQAQRHGVQNAVGDQSDVTADMQRANAELRGKPDAGRDAFPEFEAPHLTLSSAAGIHMAAADSTHLASDEHTSLTAGGHISIAARKSFLASVREKIAFYGQKAMTLVTPGPVQIESRNGAMTQSSQGDMSITSTQGIVQISGKNGVDIRCGGTLLRIRPDGITGYTNGGFLVHAANHATANPEAKPVDYPVTPDNPGKLAAHHVLVEDGGGFAVANQPYRLTLDDGQVIQGVTSELGELQIATSNAVSFGVVELMSQSEPDNVVGVAETVIYADADRKASTAAPVMPKRDVQIGGKTVSTPDTVATSQEKPSVFITCDPLNFGLRTSRLVGKAKQSDVPPSNDRRMDVEYPVAKKYTEDIKKCFRELNWKELAEKPSEDAGKIISNAIGGVICDSLKAGSFGLPDSAVPAIAFVGPDKFDTYGMKSNYAACFNAKFWAIVINQSIISQILKESDPFAKNGPMQTLANTLYHEARHCQQNFWIVSLWGTHPDDYAAFKNLENYYRLSTEANILKIARRTTFPDDEVARIGVHRMLVFQYYWFMSSVLDETSDYRKDFKVVEEQVCKLLNITPDVARLRAKHDPGYKSHLHEEDAYTCGDVVDRYWTGAAYFPNPGACRTEYLDTIRAIGASRNG